MKPKLTTEKDKDLLDQLGVEATPTKTKKHSAREERIIAGFEEIEKFVEENGRVPQHGEDRDIFERIYAVRLDAIRDSQECRVVLKGLDTKGLLNRDQNTQLISEDKVSDEALLATLGIDKVSPKDVSNLTHVRSKSEIRAAEEIAQRTPCKDFHKFKPLFAQVQADLKNGARETVKFGKNAEIRKGDLYVLDGQKILVADIGDSFIAEYGRLNCRLRVIYDNGTESDLLMRSLQRALYKDEKGRRITNSNLGPLFTGIDSPDETESGYIYVLRSKSDHPFIAENRKIIHKIGVTRGNIKTRIAHAKKDPTYLLADVEVVATFKLININEKGFESLLHKFFNNARLDLEMKDRFNFSVKPREWFMVPLEIIEEVVDKITDGSIENYRFDRETASILPM